MIRAPLEGIRMHPVIAMAVLLCASLWLVAPAAAQTELDTTLSKVATYQHDQGRQPLLDLEALLRRIPAAEAEPRMVRFLESDATLAGKDFVCRQLSLMGSDSAVPVLARMLRAEDTAEMARYALERIPGEASMRALREGYSQAPVKARPGILNTLGIRRDAAAVELMIATSNSSDLPLRLAAIHAMGKVASPAALNALASMRKEGSAEALEASLVAAEQLVADKRRAEALAIYRELLDPKLAGMVRTGALMGIASVDEAAALPLAAAGLKDENLTFRQAAVSALRQMRSPSATEALKTSLPGLEAATRAQVVTALAVRGDAAARDAVIESTKDEALVVRIAALEGIAMLEAPAVVKDLAVRAAQESLEEAERNAARMALARMRGEAADQAIIAAIPAAENPVKLELIRAAGDRAIFSAAGTILPVISDPDRGLRREALRSLRETAGAPQVPALLDMLTEARSQADRRELERVLASALRRSPPDSGKQVAAAYQAATAQPLKAALLTVMGQAGNPQSLPVLREALHQSEAELVRAAILGLTDWPDDAPLADLLRVAGETKNPAHRVLALRGILNLVPLPTERPASESVAVLSRAFALADQAAEKKAILGLLPMYPGKETLALARNAMEDAAVAEEAKMAAQRIERALRPR